MASEQSSLPEERATVEGKPALMRIDDNGLDWSKDTQSGLSWSTIPFKHIIAVEPLTSASADEYTLLYVDKVPNARDDAATSPLSFKSLRVSGLPEPLLRDFKCSDSLVWRRRNDVRAVSIHVIISTGSGTGLASVAWKQLVQPFLSHLGYADKDYTVHSTTSESSVTELILNTVLSQANEGKAQSILLLSGDGGLIDIINALLNAKRTAAFRKPTITLLALGTGNAMANSTTIVPNDNTLGLRTLLLGSPENLPLFRATFSPGARLLTNESQDEANLNDVAGVPTIYGAVVLSWGLHATLVADSDTAAYRKFGSARFQLAAKEALFPSDGSLPHAYTGRVSILKPGDPTWTVLERRQHGYILATLVSNLEAGFTISPASRPLDGELRLVHFGRLSGEEAMEIMNGAYQGGKHVEDERVGYEAVEGLRVDFEEESEEGMWRRVCVDGRIVRVERGGWVEVRREGEGVVELFRRKEEGME